MAFKNATVRGEKIGSYAILVLPAVVIYLSVMAFPTLFSLFLSFTDYNVYKNTFVMVGFKHFITMFTDPLFYLALKNNFLIIFISVFGQIPLGFVLAYILFRKLVRFRSLFQSMIFMPTMISTIIIGVLWSSIFSAHGFFNSFMKIFYGPDYVSTVFLDPNLAMMPILFVILWMYTGTYLIIFIANLQKIDMSIIEAALVDGASEAQILRRIILPSLSGVVVTTVILAISGSMKSFELIFAMTQGGPAHYTSVLCLYLYENSFKLYDYSYGSAVSTVLIIISFILIGVTKALDTRYGGKE